MQRPLIFVYLCIAIISAIIMKGELIMTYKQIQTSHEIRMWIGQVIIPMVIGGIMLATNVHIKTWIGNKVGNTMLKINSKKNKGGK